MLGLRSMWQKALLSLACFAVCLPTHALTSCCCTRAAASISAQVKPSGSKCCHAEPPTSCCASLANDKTCPTANIVEPGTEPGIGNDCDCACGTLHTTATIAKSAELPPAPTAITIGWQLPSIAATFVLRSCDSDPPPIAHNRRQSQLCVWQN